VLADRIWHPLLMVWVDDARATWLARNVLPNESALRAWLRRRGLQHAAVDDVLQETYAVLAELQSTEHIRDARTYMFSVARNVMLQHLRRSRIVPIDFVADTDRLSGAIQDNEPEQHAAAAQLAQRFQELLAELPEKCRQAFTLRKVEGLSQREAAARMGISENTIEKHVGKALRVFLDYLDDEQAERLGEPAPPERRQRRP